VTLLRRSAAEALGTAFLLAGVVGSGIMAQRLSGGNHAIALLANTLATGGVLMCLIAALGPVSGAHLNPAVSFVDALRGGLPWREVPAYGVAQVFGALIGVGTANAMFGLPFFFASHHARSGPPQLFAEFVATFGLLVVIWGCVRFRSAFTPFAIAAYIVAAYWFTSSTSFANPAVTIARSLSDTFAGIRPQDVPGFIAAQLLGATCATLFFSWLVPVKAGGVDTIVVAHDGGIQCRRLSRSCFSRPLSNERKNEA
jgi:glycerol uptake facilitator-like aquaporin